MIASPGMKDKHVMIAPLDWGLGHATRCIPIVKTLLKKGCVVHLGSNGNALLVLRNEFPDLPYVELPAYDAYYSKTWPFMLNIFRQLPKFLQAISREKEVLKEYESKHPLDLIISDNRYGCRLKHVKSVFLSHHLNIRMPDYFKWLSPVLNFVNRRFLKGFDEHWIPDDPKESLSGKLSNPAPNNSRRIGLLSRFTTSYDSVEKYKLAIIISGPEPQRSLFEKLILKQISAIDFKAILIRGLPAHQEPLSVSSNIEIVNYMGANDLQRVILSSELILCRSGYSSVMDLAILGKKAIFVPTPGQTEQEYLAYRLMEMKIAYFQSQHEFELKKAMTRAVDYSGFTGYPNDQQDLIKALEEALL